MIRKNNKGVCPICKGNLKYYDKVNRMMKTRYGVQKWIKVRRMRCVNCGVLHRELPDTIIPYKQYESKIIYGVIEGIITPDTIGYEDYPCELTMKRWISHNLQASL